MTERKNIKSDILDNILNCCKTNIISYLYSGGNWFKINITHISTYHERTSKFSCNEVMNVPLSFHAMK